MLGSQRGVKRRNPVYFSGLGRRDRVGPSSEADQCIPTAALADGADIWRADGFHRNAPYYRMRAILVAISNQSGDGAVGHAHITVRGCRARHSFIEGKGTQSQIAAGGAS